MNFTCKIYFDKVVFKRWKQTIQEVLTIFKGRDDSDCPVKRITHTMSSRLGYISKLVSTEFTPRFDVKCEEERSKNISF